MDSNRCLTLNNGLKMPIIGLGTWQATPEEIKTAVTAAVEAGYRHIDTAFAYFNETAIGDVLQELFAAGKIKREDIFITTKLPSNGHRRERVEYFLKKSLAALKLDYVDLYLIHAPFSAKGKDDKEIFAFDKDGNFVTNPETDLVETWKGMEECVEKGIAKSIGVSNFNSEQIQRVCNVAKIVPANLQVECHAYFPQKELFKFCAERGITMTAYGPIGSPGLGEFTAKRFKLDKVPELPSPLKDNTVLEIANKKNKTAAQILLRYLIQRGICVIPKSSNPSRIAENIDVFDFEFNEDDMKSLSNLSVHQRLFKFDFHPSFLTLKEYPFSIPF